MNNYYNTNNESGDTLKKSVSKAKNQEEAILAIFQSYGKLTASECWQIFDPNGNIPITSVRRAITNLYHDLQIAKTEEMKQGIYGKKEHVYRLIGEIKKTDNY